MRIFEGLIEVNRIAVFSDEESYLEKTISGDNNGMTLTVSRKLAKIGTVSRKSNHPMETLLFQQKAVVSIEDSSITSLDPRKQYTHN